MKLWVLRHGEAEPHARSDAERNLTANGRKEVLSISAQMIGQPLSVIYASPYTRAQQTAQLVRETLGFEPEVRTVKWLTPDHDPPAVVDQLDLLDNVLLVSHNPLVGNLIAYLQHGHWREPQRVGTAGLVELEGDWPLAGLMSLKSIKHP